MHRFRSARATIPFRAYCMYTGEEFRLPIKLLRQRRTKIAGNMTAGSKALWRHWWNSAGNVIKRRRYRCAQTIGRFTFKARRGFAFVTESWVRKFDGQLSVCAQMTYDVMESVGAKEITSFTVESWGCKTQCLGVFLGESVNLAAP